MSQNSRHIVISAHKNVQIARAETMYTFSLRFFCILQICKGNVTYTQTDIHTQGQTDRQSLLEDASRIKSIPRNTNTMSQTQDPAKAFLHSASSPFFCLTLTRLMKNCSCKKCQTRHVSCSCVIHCSADSLGGDLLIFYSNRSQRSGHSNVLF